MLYCPYKDFDLYVPYVKNGNTYKSIKSSFINMFGIKKKDEYGVKSFLDNVATIQKEALDLAKKNPNADNVAEFITKFEKLYKEGEVLKANLRKLSNNMKDEKERKKAQKMLDFFVLKFHEFDKMYQKVILFKEKLSTYEGASFKEK